MINREEFVNEMKMALNLPNSYNINGVEPVCYASTDEILDPGGFDLKLGEQTFHIDFSWNINLASYIKKIPFILFPQNTIDEVLAIKDIEWCQSDSSFIPSEDIPKGIRPILENGAKKSWLCRYYAAYLYYVGGDGEEDKTKSYEMLVCIPQKGIDKRLTWIKDVDYRMSAAYMCAFSGRCNHLGKIQFLNLASECSKIKGRKWVESGIPQHNLHSIGMSLFEDGKRKMAFDYFNVNVQWEKREEDVVESYFMLGISYMFGFYESDDAKAPSNIPKEKLLLARAYFEKSIDKRNRISCDYKDEEYDYLSYLYWQIGETSKTDKVFQKGVEKGYAMPLFRWGVRVFGNYYSEGRMESVDLLKKSLKAKHAFWFTKIDSTFLNSIETRINDTILLFQRS